MVDRDPTLGELKVMLTGIQSSIDKMEREMVTTDVFTTWRDGNSDRVKRVEDAVEKWTEVSTKAHVASEERDAALEKEFRRELKALETKIDDQAGKIAQARNIRANVWLAAALAVLGSIAVNVWRQLFGGS
jgi:hypothetical protein